MPSVSADLIGLPKS